MVEVLQGPIGADLSKTYETADYDAPPFTLGTIAKSADGREYMFVEADGTITQNDCVAIDEDNLAVAMTKALADAGHTPGWCNVSSVGDGDYFWAVLKGSNFSIRVAGSCAKDVQLYTTSTAGVLDDTSTSQTLIRGAVLATTNGTTGVNSVEARIAFPSATATP